MNVTSSKDKMEFTELSKLISKARQIHVRNFNVKEIEEAVRKGTSTKSVREKLQLEENKMHALKDKESNFINNFKEIVNIAEDFYSELYSSPTDQAKLVEIKSEQYTEIPCTTTDEVMKAVKGMSRGKAAGEDAITADLIKHGGDIIFEKLPSLFTKCTNASSVPLSWKNANIIVIQKKGHIKELKNCTPISLLPVI